MSDVTQILSRLEAGDPSATDELLPLVYAELRKLAAAKLAHEKPGQTLEATALVHEAYLRLVDASLVPNWNSRGHFFAAAAEAMRRILIERARWKQAEQHGGGRERVALADVDCAIEDREMEILSLDAALTKLADIRPQAAELVKLRFFAGLTVDQAAAVVGISPRTARRLWTYAQAWLRREIELDHQ
jgi:RNA polymerase sigma factor (TIGR02999 family)